MHTDFFAEFPPVSKEQWLARIAKDLKDRPIEELYWLNEGIPVDPFGHADDGEAATPIWTEPKAWEICETLDVQDPENANALALNALQFGAEGLHFQLNGAVSLPELLKDIHLDYISLHFSANDWSVLPPAQLLASLQEQAQSGGLAGGQLRGSVAFTPHARFNDWRYVADWVAYAHAQTPGFKTWCIPDDSQADATVAGLATQILQAHTAFQKTAALGLETAVLAQHLFFDLAIGPHYFWEIARLRALHILWMNLLKAWGLAPALPQLHVRFRPEAYGDSLYSNMIRSTTMAMSAVIGGADVLSVLPGSADEQHAPVFVRRIARNVQHLLKMEGYFDTFADPAAGSYYIEQLTRKIATEAWSQFQQQQTSNGVHP